MESIEDRFYRQAVMIDNESAWQLGNHLNESGKTLKQYIDEARLKVGNKYLGMEMDGMYIKIYDELSLDDVWAYMAKARDILQGMPDDISLTVNTCESLDMTVEIAKEIVELAKNGGKWSNKVEQEYVEPDRIETTISSGNAEIDIINQLRIAANMHLAYTPDKDFLKMASEQFDEVSKWEVII